MKEGETVDSLRGMADFISMTNRALGSKLMNEINELEPVEKE